MLKVLKSGLILGGLLLSQLCYSQDVPLGTMPLFYNSSFAGEGDELRINSNLDYSTWNKINVIGIQTSFDQFIPRLRSGVGIIAGHSNASGISYSANSSTLGLAIAPKFSLKGKVTISPSLDFHYTSQRNRYSHISGYSSRVGFLLNTSKFFIGYSATAFHNITREDLVTLQVRKTGYVHSGLHSVQIGYTFQRSQDSRFSFTPQALLSMRWHSDSHWDLTHRKFMLNFRYDKILWGISDNGLHVGLQTPKVRIIAMHNVDRLFTDQRLNQSRGSITTLSFRYNFLK